MGCLNIFLEVYLYHLCLAISGGGDSIPNLTMERTG